MDVTFSDILNLLTSPTGSAFYHLIPAICVAGAFQFTYAMRPEGEDPSYLRLIKGLMALIFTILASLIVSILSIAVADLNIMLPPLDRMFAAIATLIMVWIWAFPNKSPRGDVALWLVAALIFFAGLVSGLIWLNSASHDYFNGSALDSLWAVAIFLIAAAGIALLVIRRSANWEMGAVMFALFIFGAIIHLLFPGEGNLPAAFRLAQIIAFPFLFSVPVRLSKLEKELREESPSPDSRIESMPDNQSKANLPDRIDPLLISSFLSLATEKDPHSIYTALTKSLAQSLGADMCLLFVPPSENNQFILISGFDLIREASIPEQTIPSINLPNLTTTVERKSSLRLPSTSKSPDLSTLAKALNQTKIGSLLAHTILDPDGVPLAVLMLLSPYSQRNWDKHTENLLLSLSPYFARLLAEEPVEEITKEFDLELAHEPSPQASPDETIIVELEKTRQKVTEQEKTILNMESLLTAFDGKQEQFEQLQAENTLLQQQIAELESAQTEQAQSPEELVTLTDNLENANQRIAALQSELDRASAVSPPQLEQLSENLERANRKIAQLQSEVEKARAAIPQASSETGLALSLEQAEVIASIAQDVRQPLSSITGYTDLLLGESVGILGALQKKFLERVKTSTDRMNSLIDDLVQITALDSGNIELSTEAVDLAEVFDDALANTSAQLREKNISLRVDMPGQLPRLSTDRDALLQIIHHLVQNAGDASPADGEISLHAHLEQAEDSEDQFVNIQVTDTGGGIPEEELPRVFSRLYRADNPLIQGVGDTGVGLSIAKTLTEALGGEISVQTQSGFGSTFNILLPLSREIPSA